MRGLSLAIIAASIVFADNKRIGPASSEDEYLVVSASAIVERAAITKLLGSDPGMDMIVVDVKVAPRGENKININNDDFTLISRKDGQRSQPMAPGQIAGKGALVVVQGGGGGVGGLMNGNRGPIWGGMPGTGTRPQRAGGDGEVAATGGPASEADSAIKAGSDNPLLDILKQKALPQTETNEPVSGLLYFLFEGKHKLKDLELMYKSPAGRLMLDFQK